MEQIKNSISQYIGTVWEGFEVVASSLNNQYKKPYGKNSKPYGHMSYNFTLENKETGLSITISGNQMRLIRLGKRTIHDMLHNASRGGKNKQIYQLKKLINQGTDQL